MPVINNFRIEKQAGGELCWAAATKAVFDHYFPGRVPSQHWLWRRFGKEGEAGSPEPALRGLNCLSSVESFLGDETALRLARQVFLKVEDHIARSAPVIVYVQQAAGGYFRHALVIYGTERAPGTQTDLGNLIVLLKDPGAPRRGMRTNIHDLLLSWKLYGNDAGDLRTFARRFFFTQRPNQFGFDLALGVGGA